MGCEAGNCVDGHGVYTWPDGQRYEGEFKDGKTNGHGLMTQPGLLWGTSVREGVWNADSLSAACDVAGCAAESVTQARQAGRRARVVAENAATAATASAVSASASAVEAARKAASTAKTGRKASAAGRNAGESASKASREATKAGKSGNDAGQRQRAQKKAAKQKEVEARLEEEAAKAEAVREEGAKAREAEEADEAAKRARLVEEENAKANEVKEEAARAFARAKAEEEARAKRAARREEAAKAEEVKEEATKAEARINAQQKAAETAAGEGRARDLKRFLSHADLEIHFDALWEFGIESAADLSLATDEDLRLAGVAKPFPRRMLLRAAQQFRSGGGDGGGTTSAGDGDGLDDDDAGTAALLKITALMRAGDAHMTADDCELARQAYGTAAALALAHQLGDVRTMLEWKLFKADTCLGSAVLPLPGPGDGDDDGDPTCGIAALGDEALMADFNAAASRRRGFGRVKRWDKWFELFGLTETSCRPALVKRAYYQLIIQYHPDKFAGPSHCALAMSLVVNAAKELLDKHAACDEKSDREL